MGTGEMAPQFRVLTVLSEDMYSVPSTYMVTHNVHNSCSGAPDILFWTLWSPNTHVVCMHTWKQNTQICKVKEKNLFIL